MTKCGTLSNTNTDTSRTQLATTMATQTIRYEVQLELNKLLDEACAERTAGLPYASAVLVAPEDKTGSDDILWLASCTKLVTTIACLQLVENDTLSLDDSKEVEAICPELKNVMVLMEDGSLVPKIRGITLRMLLTHTAGFGYSFLNGKLNKYKSSRSEDESKQFDEFSGVFEDILQPLVNQPGETFEYGISIDWAGVLVERAARMNLNDYMQRHIFQPLNIRDLSMIPSSQMRTRLVGLWQRNIDGSLSPREYPLSRALDNKNTSDCTHSGGAGLFGSIRQFSKIITALINGGKSPETTSSILSPASVSQMFTNQLPQWPNFARRHLPAAKLDLVYPAEGLYPVCPPSFPQGFGLGCLISPGITGRSDGTVHWTGLSNVFWWLDQQNGIGGVVASQVLPFADPQAATLWVHVETRAYEGLQKTAD
ncbi:beta-lactamase family protein [Coniochaeta ligniaria NRRL 30616]|uniref:Beta-lactamase family protein n=1 Tax=Coniochaeta ligniaria NRRL 30616 TaxID=1408157 RepID=A0A1J7J7E2_9PEZI|nr:beta-lactamase family protein [Coniochaeta ligniaria NRRL 30616]